MIRSLHQRAGIVTSAAAASIGSLPGSAARPLSSRALSIALENNVATKNSMGTKKCIMYDSRRPFHRSTFGLKSIDDVQVTIESSKSPSSSTKTELSTSSEAEGSTCSQGISNVEEDEEDEQEEMFVTADPVLGIGNIQEWGGPRRGGRMLEPTRFGDWERKGRCSDF